MSTVGNMPRLKCFINIGKLCFKAQIRGAMGVNLLAIPVRCLRGNFLSFKIRVRLIVSLLRDTRD